jgi:hypothetical protein
LIGGSKFLAMRRKVKEELGKAEPELEPDQQE